MDQLDGVLLGHATRPLPIGHLHHNPTEPHTRFCCTEKEDYYSRGYQVGSQTPETALRHVSQTIVLAGYSDPRQ